MQAKGPLVNIPFQHTRVLSPERGDKVFIFHCLIQVIITSSLYIKVLHEGRPIQDNVKTLSKPCVLL